MNRHPVTPAGYVRLQEELQHLKSVVRPGIVRDIEEARAQGDISENSEYEDAKERQSHCEGRIAYLEGVVAAAEVIDVTKVPRNGRAVFGTTVVLESGSGEPQVYRIVGELEADVNVGRISYKSPLGVALIGKEEGDEVVVPTPGGRKVYSLVEVRYEAG